MEDMFAPYGNSSDQFVKSWRPEPHDRGTFSILSSCFVTLCLCVWTAIHLNIPEHRRTSSQWLRKTGWLLMGVFAPEMVAYTAYFQYMEARKLDQFMRERYPFEPSRPWCRKMCRFFRRKFCCNRKRNDDLEQAPRANSGRVHPWTRVHSQYAVMGGFSLDTSDAEHPGLPGDRVRLTVTPDGLMWLAEHEASLIPDISKEEIEDKSKANGLAKAIVCVQSFWFCIQCLARLSQGLPITQLELNTFIHALCALLIYWLWWDKPLDITEPTLIQGRRAHELVALLSITFYRTFNVVHNTRCNRSPLWRRSYIQRLLPSMRWDALTETDIGVDTQSSFPVRLYAKKILLGVAWDNWEFRQCRCDRCVFNDGCQNRWITCTCEPESLFIELSECDLNCLMLASNARQRYYNRISYTAEDGLVWEYIEIPTNIEKKSCPRARNWPDMNAFAKNEFFSGIRPKPVTVGFSIAGLVYGMVHLSAWGAPFQSPAQRILWQISGIRLVASGPAIIILTFWAKLSYFDKPKSENTKIKKWVIIPVLFITTLAVVLPYCLLYIFSRVYIVAECFISFSHLPEGVYKLPKWSAYFPHIS